MAEYETRRQTEERLYRWHDDDLRKIYDLQAALETARERLKGIVSVLDPVPPTRNLLNGTAVNWSVALNGARAALAALESTEKEG